MSDWRHVPGSPANRPMMVDLDLFRRYVLEPDGSLGLSREGFEGVRGEIVSTSRNPWVAYRLLDPDALRVDGGAE